MARPGVRRYVAIPLLINVLLFGGALWAGAGQIVGLVESNLPGWLEWLSWVLVPLLVIIVAVAGFFLFNVLANLIAAPFNGLLAEAIEVELGGRPRPGGGWRGMLRDLGVTIGSELRKALYMLLRAVPLLVLLWVPGINVVASLLWLVLGAWMMAVAYGDYPMANHGLGFAAQRPLLAAQRWTTLGFGAAVMVALGIPLLNFLVIPAAVAGATVMWVDHLAPQASSGPAEANPAEVADLRG